MLKATLTKTFILILVALLSACNTIQFDPLVWKNSHFSAPERTSQAREIKEDKAHQSSNHLKTSVTVGTPGSPAEEASKECVVLVHGLWRSAFAMRSIESFLVDHHYTVKNISYPSTTGSIDQLVHNHLKPAVESCQQESDITHIVTHSMGGILAQHYLQTHRLSRDSKVVLLSPPSQGSELAESFKDNDFFSYLAGSAAMTLHQQEGGVINSLKAFPEISGVIAGYRSWSLWPESWLPKPNDGMVSLESMITPGMDDLVLINTGHAMMRYRQEVKQQILHFLKQGSFNHQEEQTLAQPTNKDIPSS